MREIKFRGFGETSKEWVDGDLIHGVGPKSGKVYILPNRINLAYVKNCHPLDGVCVIPDSVGQFTGKPDRSGKEIFEGDLISAVRANSSLGGMNDIYKVVYSEKYCAFCLECVKSDNDYRVGKIAITSGDRPYLIDSKISVVIGSIYDNPELIK